GAVALITGMGGLPRRQCNDHLKERRDGDGWGDRRGGERQRGGEVSAAPDADHAGVSLADREGLVGHARRMAADDLAPGTSGNLSVRRGGLIAITPSGLPDERVGPAGIWLGRAPGAAPVSGR